MFKYSKPYGMSLQHLITIPTSSGENCTHVDLDWNITIRPTAFPIQHCRMSKIFTIRNQLFFSSVLNTRKSVSSRVPITQKWVVKMRCSRVFLTDFELFGHLMKHSFECGIIASQTDH